MEANETKKTLSNINCSLSWKETLGNLGTLISTCSFQKILVSFFFSVKFSWLQENIRRNLSDEIFLYVLAFVCIQVFMYVSTMCVVQEENIYLSKDRALYTCHFFLKKFRRIFCLLLT